MLQTHSMLMPFMLVLFQNWILTEVTKYERLSITTNKFALVGIETIMIFKVVYL